MEQKQPVSFGELVSNNNTSKWKIIIITILFTVLVIVSANVIYNTYTKTDFPTNAQIITLKDVVIAYTPETKRIIFLNRNSGQVQFSLSDSVSLAIFALKYSEITTDYSLSLTNKK